MNQDGDDQHQFVGGCKPAREAMLILPLDKTDMLVMPRISVIASKFY